MAWIAQLHPWIAAGVSLAILVGLQVRRAAPPEVLFLGGLAIVTLVGIISPEKALAGFANPGVMTIAGLLVVSAALRYSGVLDYIGQRLLGDTETEQGALGRIALSCATASAFLLNTALVAMLMPVLLDWCRRHNVSPSRLLLPLSYFTIIGGVCSLIGTSTNLVTQGMLRDVYARREAALAEFREEKIVKPLAAAGQAVTDARIGTFLAEHPAVATELARLEEKARQVAPMSLFEIAWAGIPCAILGSLYIVFIGRHLLPDKSDIVEEFDEHRREYLVEMVVPAEAALVNKSIEDAGLRRLPGLFLIEIDRAGDIITPVTPSEVLRANDRLIFTGVVSTIIDLEKTTGLIPAADSTYEFHPQKRQQRQMIEAVISRSSPLVGRSVRDANFRELYNAAVVAIHRNGGRLAGKIGEVVLEPGDTLLLQTRSEFVSTHSNNPDFYMVRNVEGDEPRRYDKAWLAGALALALIAWLTATSWLPTTGPWAALGSTAIASIAVALLMVLSRCIPPSDARDAIDLQTLITIAAALGVGLAMSESGAARGIADGLVSLTHQLPVSAAWQPLLLLVILYVLSAGMTEMITNNAVAAMMFPIALATAEAGDYSPRPYIIGVTLAASMSFLTPIGYQTNLMVLGPGGYQPSDYVKFGLPMAGLMTITALSIIPWVWPF